MFGMEAELPDPNDLTKANGGFTYNMYEIIEPDGGLEPNANAFLNKCGIHKIIVGHLPVGDIPLVINCNDALQVRNLLLLFANNNYYYSVISKC